VKVARARLAQDLRVDEADVKIGSRFNMSMQDSERIKPGVVYTVDIPAPASVHCLLVLDPTPRVGFGRSLTRELIIDLRALKTVDDLIGRYFPPSEFRNSVTIFLNGTALSRRDSLSGIPADSQLSAQYPAPRDDSAYHFVEVGGNRDKQRGIFDRTILDVKCCFLETRGPADTLPNVLKFEFWGVELPNGERFGSLLLPEDAEITISRNEAKRIGVRLLDGSERLFHAGDSDRISTLKLFVSRVMSVAVNDFVFESAVGRIDESLSISDLPDLTVTAVDPFVQLEVDSSAGPRSLRLLPTATVLDGRLALAGQLGEALESVFLLRRDGSRAADGSPLSCERLRISCLREMKFVFDSQLITISVDFDSAIAAVKEVVSEWIEIPATDLDLLYGDSEIDDEMTLNDLEISPSDFITIVPHSTPEAEAPASAGVSEVLFDTVSRQTGGSRLTGDLVSDRLMDFTGMTVVAPLGRSGRVKLLRDEASGENVVVRWFSEDSDDEILREVRLMVSCRHRCILRLIGWSMSMPRSPGQLGVEYAELGSLRDVLNGRRSGNVLDCLTNTGISIIVCGLVEVMIFLHSHGIVHRNLSPEHIFLDSSGRPKLGGFGFFCDFSVDLLQTLNLGSSLYRAPELYCQLNGGSDEYTPAVDVYSFGVILYELVVGETVFPSDTPLGKLESLVRQGVRPILPSTLSVDIRRIISRCWTVEPSARDSFDTIWTQLEKMDFKIKPNADVALVRAYNSWVNA
jgi:serine/threonine protein kinase